MSSSKDEFKKAYNQAITPKLMKLFKAAGAEGGKRAAANMTAKQRKARAMKAAEASKQKRLDS